MIFFCSNAFDNRVALAILRMPKGMDYSYLNLEVNNDLTFNGLDSPTINQSHLSLPATGDLILSGNRNLMHADSNLNLAGMASAQTTITTPQPRKQKKWCLTNVTNPFLTWQNSLHFRSTVAESQTHARNGSARQNHLFDTRRIDRAEGGAERFGLFPFEKIRWPNRRLVAVRWRRTHNFNSVHFVVAVALEQLQDTGVCFDQSQNGTRNRGTKVRLIAETGLFARVDCAQKVWWTSPECY